jgi:1A family penicillin-binding protein
MKKGLTKIKHFLRIAPQDILLAIFAVILTFGLVSIFTYVYFANDLKTKDSVMNKNNTGLILLDRNSKPFFRFYQAQYHDFIPLDQIPKPVTQAVLAAEDKNFYSHPGFSVTSIVGALVADFRHGQLDYGGSTITQQLVKNSLLNSNKNFLRKYQELILAQELERRYSKNEILEMYLNSVYWGEGSFGINSASHAYFNKNPQDLDLAESTLLAGLLTAPSRLSPISGDREAAVQRQKFILSEMVDQKIITADQAKQAEDEKLTFNQNPDDFPYKAPHFALMVKQQLDQKYGEEKIARSGFTVTTTLDLDWQDFAQQTVSEQVDKLKDNHVSNGAAVVIDPKNGEVRALVGSKDWNDPKFGKFNIAQTTRQPGSSFKPIVYAAALERRIITPATILHDQPTTYKPGPGVAASPYSPKDYDGKFRGPVTVRRALVNSLNVPAVEVESKVGIPATLEMAQRLGLTTLGSDPSPYGLSIALGAGDVNLLELTNVYATFANSGQKNDVTLITQIQDKQKNTIYSYNPKPHEVLDPGIAFQLSSILSDNATRAEEFGTLLNISRPAAVKTGTTEDYKDSLTMGFTPQIAVGVWVGNNDNTQMDKVAGSIGAAPIWKALMEKFNTGPAQKFTPPDDVASIPICKSNGLRLKEASGSADLEYFLKGTEPRAFCNSNTPPSSSNPQPSSSGDQPTPNITPPSDLNPEQGGWYPVGPGGKALQFWNGQWFENPQQEKKDKKD